MVWLIRCHQDGGYKTRSVLGSLLGSKAARGIMEPESAVKNNHANTRYCSRLRYFFLLATEPLHAHISNLIENAAYV